MYTFPEYTKANAVRIMIARTKLVNDKSDPLLQIYFIVHKISMILIFLFVLHYAK